MILSSAGNGIMAFMIPLLVSTLVDIEISRSRKILQIFAAVLLVFLGGADDLFPGSILPTLDILALAALMSTGLPSLPGISSASATRAPVPGPAHCRLRVGDACPDVVQLIVRSFRLSPVLREFG